MDFFASLGRPDVLDLSRQTQYFWALLPEIVLSLGAMLLLILDVVHKGDRSEPSRQSIAVGALIVLAVTAVANVALLGVRDASADGMVAVDGFRTFTNFVYLLAAGLAIATSMGYLERRGIMRGEFHALVLFATLGMMLMGGSRDLIMTFIGLEVMSVSVYVLVGFDRLDPRSSEASLKYFLLGAFSSGFFLYGIALTFGAVGSTNLTYIANVLGAGDHGHDLLLMAGIAMTMVGFGFKVAAIPFHMWTPDAYDGAPTPVTSLMATGVKAAAFAAFVRVFAVAFTGVAGRWVPVAWWLAAVTMIGANLIALTQGSVKRMLAYSSIAHAGYLTVALLSNNDAGKAAFLFYILVYTLMTAGAFGIVIGNAREDGQERVTLEDYAGFGWSHPALGALFAVFLLSLAGFPLTAGFLGKLFILRAAVEAKQTPLAVFLVLSSLVSYFYYLRVIVVMYMRPAPQGETRAVGLPAPAMTAVALAGLAVVLLFFAGSPALGWAERSAGSLWRSPAPVSGPVAAAPAR